MKRSYLSGIDEKTTINDVIKEIQLSRFDYKIRNLIRYSLSEYLTHLPLPGKVVKVLTFGSVVKNIAVKGSDLDLTIVTNDIRNLDFSYFNFLTSWSQSPYGRTQAAAVISAVEHHMRKVIFSIFVPIARRIYLKNICCFCCFLRNIWQKNKI